jgi:hypothetical protein
MQTSDHSDKRAVGVGMDGISIHMSLAIVTRYRYRTVLFIRWTRYKVVY